MVQQTRTRATVIIMAPSRNPTPPPSRPRPPVREEVVEGDDGVISSVIVPTLKSVAEDAMEEESDSAAEVPQ